MLTDPSDTDGQIMLGMQQRRVMLRLRFMVLSLVLPGPLSYNSSLGNVQKWEARVMSSLCAAINNCMCMFTGSSYSWKLLVAASHPSTIWLRLKHGGSDTSLREGLDLLLVTKMLPEGEDVATGQVPEMLQRLSGTKCSK